MKILVSVMGCLLGLAATAGAAQGVKPDPLLCADGQVLRNAHGKGDVVALRGVNLGGWLEWQAWMCPINSEGADTVRDLNEGHNGYDFDVRNLLVQRFGAAKADRLIDAYDDAWITPRDLDNIHNLGFNAVRLTFAYDTLLNNDGTWRANAFQRMDWLIKQAWKRGIYTIVDYHAFLPPAADQNGSATGYWADNRQIEETERIWKRIAQHYRGNPAVAMYDLLNEPNNSIAKTGQKAPSAETVRAVYDRLYRAIRSVDEDHAIAMEGVWGWDTLADPRTAGYRNVVYSFHWYYFWAKDTADRKRAVDEDIARFTTQYREWNVPCFIGEFNLFGDIDAWRYAIKRMDEVGISWTIWTYKNTASGDNSWGVYTTIPNKRPPVPNINTDSYEQIRDGWQRWSTDGGGFQLNPLFAQLFGKAK